MMPLTCSGHLSDLHLLNVPLKFLFCQLESGPHLDGQVGQ